MLRYLLAFICICTISGCGAALPAILTGITTAAQLIQLFDNTISPQYMSSQQNCANQINAIPEGDVTGVVAACDELVDAFYALAPVVEQLRSRTRDADLLDKAKICVAEYDESYAKYKRDVP